MEIRLMGTREECTAAVDALRAAPGLTVLRVSRPYRNRGGSDQVRVFVHVVVQACFTAAAEAGGG